MRGGNRASSDEPQVLLLGKQAMGQGVTLEKPRVQCDGAEGPTEGNATGQFPMEVRGSEETRMSRCSGRGGRRRCRGKGESSRALLWAKRLTFMVGEEPTYTGGGFPCQPESR